MSAARTHLKRDTGNTEESLCNWIELTDVNVLLVLCGWGPTDLCDDSAKLERLIHCLICRPAHHWGVFYEQSFEFMERQAEGFHLRKIISRWG